MSMNLQSLFHVAALSVGATFARPLPAELAWHPDEGAMLRRELVTEQLLVTESMAFHEGGERTVSQRIFDLSTTTTLRTSDRMLEVGEGRPLRLRRFYDEARIEARAELSGGRQSTRSLELRGASPFQGQSVVFTWVPEDEEYGRYFDGLEGREETLPGLAEDLGARGLLPTADAAEGSEWIVPVDVLEHLLAPGGELAYSFEGAEDPLIARSLLSGVGANGHLLFGETTGGELRVTWTATEEQDGLRLAILSLDFEAEFTGDLTDRSNELRSAAELATRQVTTEARTQLELEGTGEVRWNLDAGCLHDTSELRADQRLTFSKAMEFQDGEDTRRTRQELVMKGSIRQKSRVVVE